MQELFAMFAKAFRKGRFNRRRFSKRPFQKDEVKKGDKGKSTIIKLDKAKIKCFNCSELGHFASECKKPRNSGKGKALMVTQKDWADSSDSEDELDYDNIALMASASDKTGYPNKSSSSSVKVSIHSLDSYDCLDSDEIRTIHVEFKNLMTNFRILTSERDELKLKNDELVGRNNFLESELIQMDQYKLDSEKAKYNYGVILEAYDFVRKELEEEREHIKSWTNSSQKTQDICDRQILGKVNGLGFDKANKNNTDTVVTVSNEASTSKSLGKMEIPEPNHVKFVDSNGTPVVHKRINNNLEDKRVLEKPKNVNIGFLSKSQLKKKIRKLFRVC